MRDAHATIEGMRGLHKKLAWWLAGVSVVAAVGLGVPVYLGQEARVHELALDRAKQAIAFANMDLKETNGTHAGPGLDSEAVRRTMAKVTSRNATSQPGDVGRYAGGMVVDLQGKELDRFGEEDALRQEARALLGRMPVPKETKVSGADALTWEEVRIGGKRGLLVNGPLEDGEGNVAAWLRGAFVMSDEAVAAMRWRAFWTAAMAMGIVLVTSALLFPVIVRLTRRVTKDAEDLLEANLSMLQTLGSAIAQRDSDTNLHNYRVTLYAAKLGEAKGLSSKQMRGLIKGALLHDVGKIGVADRILLKPGKLTDEEYAEMKKHVEHGRVIVRESAWLTDAAEVVAYHHEKYDGSGYDGKLKGEAIPLAARIFAVADVFDALTSKRPYKEGMTVSEAMVIIKKDAGTHFDPELVKLFEPLAEAAHQEANAEEHAVRGRLAEVIGGYFKAG